MRLDVDLGPDVSLGSLAGADEIISPDGTRIVYVSQGRLFTRRLNQPNATELAGTQGAYAPFFSPDGQWVAFFTPGKLEKISVEGGSAIPCATQTLARGGSWGEDGNIIAALSATRRPVADSFRWRSANASDRLAERRSHPPLAASPAGRQGRAVHG